MSVNYFANEIEVESGKEQRLWCGLLMSVHDSQDVDHNTSDDLPVIDFKETIYY